jgi:hypothetical protein
VYVNIINNGEGPIHAFQLAIEATGNVDITAVDTIVFDNLWGEGGGASAMFWVGTLMDPDANDGRRAALAVAHEGNISIVRPGTMSVVALTIEPFNQTAGEAIGQLRFTDGLVHSGLPVENHFVGDDAAYLDVCNLSTASLTIEFPPAAGTFRRGDSNDDGKVDISDGIWIISELFGGGPPAGCRAAADANFDHAVDLSDALYLIEYNFHGGSPPPLPFPDCGAVASEAQAELGCDRFESCQ